MGVGTGVCVGDRRAGVLSMSGPSKLFAKLVLAEMHRRGDFTVRTGDEIEAVVREYRKLLDGSWK